MAGSTRGHLAHLARPGAVIAVRVTPGASRETVLPAPDGSGADLRITVTAPAEGGKANKATQALLARALGVAPSRLTLLRGASGRLKQFRLD